MATTSVFYDDPSLPEERMGWCTDFRLEICRKVLPSLVLRRYRLSGRLYFALLCVFCCVSLLFSKPVNGLFPDDLTLREWKEFPSTGYSEEVSGLIYAGNNPPDNGVPMGGLGTGSLDIEASGVFGFNTIFPVKERCFTQGYPFYRTRQLLLPFLGLSVGGKTWLLADKKYVEGGDIQGSTDPGMKGMFLGNEQWNALWRTKVPKAEGVIPAGNIRYWGHYPIADLEFETDSPVSTSLRVWAPFIPGDMAASNVPGVVFETYLCNTTETAQEGTLALSFPGPVDEEGGYTEFLRREIDEASHALKGIEVTSTRKEIGYMLGVIEEQQVRIGSGLSSVSSSWSQISSQLPQPKGEVRSDCVVYSNPSASVAIDFSLEPKQTKVVRFVLSWFAPMWTSQSYKVLLKDFEPVRTDPPGYTIPGRDNEKGDKYRAMYAARFDSAVDAARYLSENHALLLKRIISWQQEIYNTRQLPVWLRDCLVNNFCLIPETSIWAQPKAPLGDWAYPMGAFGTIESPCFCALVGCNGSNWYGSHPFLYFFPELYRMMLEPYRETMRPDGAICFIFPHGDFTKPTFEWQLGMNGPFYVDQVDRLWMRTGSDEILRRFYPSVKQSTEFTMTLVPGPRGVVSVPSDRPGEGIWEFDSFHGLVTHLGGMHLAQCKMAERMAKAMGDQEFADKCRSWFDQGSKALEEYLWNDENNTYYMYRDLENDKKSDFIQSIAIDGDWMSRSHGLGGVFQKNRAEKFLDTVKRTCLVGCGIAGSADASGKPRLEAYGTFPPEIVIVGMTYMYHNQKELGLEVVRRNMDNLFRKQGLGWSQPNLILCHTGEKNFGTDYNQNMILWAVPAAINGDDLTEPCKPGGLVDRVLKAGSREWNRN